MSKQLTTTKIVGLSLLVGATASAWDLKLGSETVTFHGFASQGFLYSSDYDYLGETTDGSFQFNEFGLNAAYSPFNRTRIAVQGFAFDVGDVGNHELLLDYASLEYTFNDYIGLRGGRVRRPGGIYNHIQDVDLARTSVLLPQGIYDSRWRDFSTSIDGGVVFGNIPMGKGGSLSYEAYGGLMNLSEEGGVAALLRNSLAPVGTVDSLDSSPIFGAQLWWNTPLDGFRAGAAAGFVKELAYDFTVPPPFGPGQMRSESDIPYFQYSLEYIWNSWTFQAEYYTYNSSSKQYMGSTQTASSRNRPESWYAGAAYRVNSWLEIGTYYTEHYADASDRSGNTRPVRADAFQKDLALSFRFDATDWWIMKLEGHYIRGTALLQDTANNPVRDTDGWWMLAAKTTFSF